MAASAVRTAAAERNRSDPVTAGTRAPAEYFGLAQAGSSSSIVESAAPQSASPGATYRAMVKAEATRKLRASTKPAPRAPTPTTKENLKQQHN